MIRDTIRKHLLAMASDLLSKLLDARHETMGRSSPDAMGQTPLNEEIEKRFYDLYQRVSELSAPVPGAIISVSASKQISMPSGPPLTLYLSRGNDGLWMLTAVVGTVSLSPPGGFQALSGHALAGLVSEIQDHVYQKGEIPAWLTDPSARRR